MLISSNTMILASSERPGIQSSKPLITTKGADMHETVYPARHKSVCGQLSFTMNSRKFGVRIEARTRSPNRPLAS